MYRRKVVCMVKQSDQITGLTDNKELFRVASIVPAEKLARF